MPAGGSSHCCLHTSTTGELTASHKGLHMHVNFSVVRGAV